MKVLFIPNYLIETGAARKLFPVWATERSVFYNYGLDWIYDIWDFDRKRYFREATRN